MAVQPASVALSTWLGTGAGITGSATAGFFIPKANVQAYVGATTGLDANISDDIRDFLFSVLSAAAAVYNADLTAGNTRPATFNISKSTNATTNTAAFIVSFSSLPLSAPTPVYAGALPAWS